MSPVQQPRSVPTNPSDALARAAPRGVPRLRILFVDSIGHGLGAHDHSICTELVRLGHEVTLATNDYEPSAPGALEYRRWMAFRGVVGDAHRLVKTWNYLRARSRIVREV